MCNWRKEFTDERLSVEHTSTIPFTFGKHAALIRAAIAAATGADAEVPVARQDMGFLQGQAQNWASVACKATFERSAPRKNEPGQTLNIITLCSIHL